MTGTHLQREVLKNPFLSWRQLSASLGGIPTMQLRKVAYWAGINCRIALRKPFLTSKNWHKHLEWAKANGSTDWRGVLFTDKAAVEVGYRPRCTRVGLAAGKTLEKTSTTWFPRSVPVVSTSRYGPAVS
ncbi:uncharacterized protein UHO2_00761 [Ustilago hordei]|uniref:uncharacterized protein n=1 Tax=Ustilago hordei TaxID=120017 RepID=UPI001A5EC65B|nr:uncharacterized protein UHO2_00761 [Ustilago hordei]SYW73896.1 uncharacterized protein UHO2_00761 [Ustilago hordei]